LVFSFFKGGAGGVYILTSSSTGFEFEFVT
jgi:hypothetical protein